MKIEPQPTAPDSRTVRLLAPAVSAAAGTSIGQADPALPTDLSTSISAGPAGAR